MDETVRRFNGLTGLMAAIAGSGVTFAGGAYAQSTATPGSNAQSGQVQEVIVTAQRRSENIQNVPVAITALSGARLTELGIKDSTQIGQFTPNVTIALPDGSGNQPLINIRGVGLNDYDTNNSGPNGVYADDLYVSAPAAQAFAVFDLNQTQVLKGPQGTLYGMNTSGGAVVFTSNKPTDRFTADAHIEYGNYNTTQIEGAVGGPIVEGLTGRIAAVINHSDGYMTNRLTDGPASGADNEAVRLQLLYKPNTRLSVLFSTTDGYVRNRPTEYRHIGVYAPGTQGLASPTVCSITQAYAGGCVDLFGYGTPSKFTDGAFNRAEDLRVFNSLNELRVDYKAGPITLTSISGLEYSDKYFPEDSDGSPNTLLDATYSVKSTTFTQELRASRTEHRFNWQAGFYFLHEYLQQNQPLSMFYDGDLFGGFGIPAGPGAFDGIAEESSDHSHQTTDAYALYGQGDYNLGKLTVTLGARYTYVQKTFDYFGYAQFQDGGLGNYGAPTDQILNDESQSNGRFTWRAALTYHFTNRILAYASAATGFKSGVFNGGFLSNDPTQAALQLKPVKPEDITAYEVGFKSTLLGRKLILNAAAFYYDYRNEQIFANLPEVIDNPTLGVISENVELLTNAKQAHTAGVEFQITAAPMPGLTIDLQPAYLNTMIDHAGLALAAGSIDLDGKQLATSPHISFTGAVDYRYPIGDDALVFDYMASYKSHQFFDSTNDPYTTQSGYWLQNVNLTYEAKGGWSAGLFVRNLANEKYYSTIFDETASFGFLEAVIGPPRTYGVQFTYRY